MIISLQYLGCDIEDIFRVLELHGLGGTIDEVARYIKEEDLPQYHEFGPRPNGRIQIIHRDVGLTYKVDFAQGKPMQFAVHADWISAFAPDENVSMLSDGQKIITKVLEGELRCSFEEEDFSVTD